MCWDGDVSRCKSVCVKICWNDAWSMKWVSLKSRRTENSDKMVDSSKKSWSGCVNNGNTSKTNGNGADKQGLDVFHGAIVRQVD